MPALLDLVLPQRCAACRRPAPWPFCGACAAQAAALRLPRAAAAALGDGVAAVGAFAYDDVVAEPAQPAPELRSGRRTPPQPRSDPRRNAPPRRADRPATAPR